MPFVLAPIVLPPRLLSSRSAAGASTQSAGPLGADSAGITGATGYARSPITAIAWISISMPGRAKFVTVMSALAG